LFHEAVIVGWKYELDGSREDAGARAHKQMLACETDACVVNGTSYGSGFGFLGRDGGETRDLADKTELCKFLADWALDALNRP
jgi:hypothetical protein